LRAPTGPLVSLILAAACVAICFGLWWYVTRGAQSEDRILSRVTLPSPAEAFQEWGSLWKDRHFLQNMWISLRRLVIGFALAAAVGIPVGVLAGCFSPVRAFLMPLILFGRNTPIAALIPLTFIFFGIGELQKIMFIFIACVAFIISDTATAIMDVGQQYIDTAYTLGANRRQTILKVLVPLAMPAVLNSERLLFGLAFGYIMLAELVVVGGELGGVGHLINLSQRQGPREHIYLILLVIPLVAFLIDRVLYWIQRQLFPHRYGGAGLLGHVVRQTSLAAQDLNCLVFPPRAPFDQPWPGTKPVAAPQPPSEMPHQPNRP
jgi:NitT/TauT family transport system permease protein